MVQCRVQKLQNLMSDLLGVLSERVWIEEYARLHAGRATWDFRRASCRQPWRSMSLDRRTRWQLCRSPSGTILLWMRWNQKVAVGGDMSKFRRLDHLRSHFVHLLCSSLSLLSMSRWDEDEWLFNSKLRLCGCVDSCAQILFRFSTLSARSQTLKL